GVKASPAMFASAPQVRRANSEWRTANGEQRAASRNNEGRMAVSFSALTTHYSPSPNSPFDGEMIVRGRRGTICEGMAGEAWSFARWLKQKEKTSRAPVPATHRQCCPRPHRRLSPLMEGTHRHPPRESPPV